MKGEAFAFGAISIVNAIASGKGASAAVNLKTLASVELVKRSGPLEVLVNERKSNSGLAIEVVKRVLKMYDRGLEQFSGRIETKSEIPIGKGLKSSSSSSVAIALATLSALGEKEYDAHDVLNCSVDASLASQTSITGALDDAAACLLGGINHADNTKRTLISSEPFEGTFKVLVNVPDQESKRSAMNIRLAKNFSKFSSLVFKMSMGGEKWGAMTLNGILYSSILGYDSKQALRAIELGALGAGLSGTGPSVAAVFRPKMRDSIRRVKKEWAAGGSKVIETETTNKQGRIVPIG